MGKGGQQAFKGAGKGADAIQQHDSWKSPYNPLAKDAPELPTKGQIKAVIPKECFERSYVKSMFYLCRDFAMAAAFAYGTSQVLSAELPSLTQDSPLEILTWVAGWSFYAFWMGTIMTGPWVCAHAVSYTHLRAHET